MTRIAQEAPGVRLHFIQKPDKDSTPLREGAVDLETGVVEPATGPELRTLALFRDRLTGVVKRTPADPRTHHGGALCRGPAHLRLARGPEFEPRGRSPACPRSGTSGRCGIVGGFSTALALARTTDLIATVPERHTGSLRDGMHSFRLPVPAPEFTVSLLGTPAWIPIQLTAGSGIALGEPAQPAPDLRLFDPGW